MKRILLFIFLAFATTASYNEGVHAQGTTGGNRASTAISTLQPETQAYLSRITTVGGSIDQSVLLQLDAFVVTGKTDGWWPSIKEFAPMYGNSVNAALVKFVVDAGGLPSMVNGDGSTPATQMQAADYSPVYGFALTSNTTKYIATGMVPTNNGLSATNFSTGIVFVPNLLQTQVNYLVGDTPASGAIQFSASSSFGMGIANTTTGNPVGGARIQTNSYSGTVQQYFNNGSALSDGTQSSTTAVINTEINLFRGFNGGVANYATGGIGGFIVGGTLTRAQSLSLNQALMRLYNNTGRLPLLASNSIIWYGDSIFAGQGSGAQTRIAALVSRALGMTEINAGVAGSQLRTVTGPIANGFGRYQDLLSLPMNTVVMMYGTNDENVGDAAPNGTAANITDFQSKQGTIVLAFKNKGARVILSCPPWNSVSNATKRAAYALAVYNNSVTFGTLYFDADNIFLDTNNPSSYFVDGIHPNVNGAALYAEHMKALMQYGRVYRDLLVPATLVPANGTTTQTFAMWMLKSYHIFLPLGAPSVTTAGITYSVAYGSDNNAVLTLKNNTGADITTTLMNIRVAFNVDNLF